MKNELVIWSWSDPTLVDGVCYSKRSTERLRTDDARRRVIDQPDQFEQVIDFDDDDELLFIDVDSHRRVDVVNEPRPVD